jgi:hypothetical protein
MLCSPLRYRWGSRFPVADFEFPEEDFPYEASAPITLPPPSVRLNGVEIEEPPAWLNEGMIGEPVRVAPPLRATPFIWREEAAIPPRRWLYGKHLLRKFVSVDVAAGGIGKSSVKIGEALAMASNRPLYNRTVHEGPLTVWLYNLEDPAEETERRLHATAKWFKIEPGEVDGRLFVDSGREQRCVIAYESPHGATIAAPVVEQLKAEIRERGIDVLIIDPFVSSHEVSENDNRAIDAVAKEWGRIADECDCSINLVHHVRKGNGTEATTDSARGAKALTDAARSVIVYNRMSEDEAGLASVPADQRSFYFRTQNDKANLSPPEKAEWFRMNNVDLANGDQVGVACPWKWPELFDGISTAKAQAVQRAVSQGNWRKDPRSGEWVGHAVAQIVGMNPEDDRKRLSAIIGEWVKNGVLKVVEKDDDQRRPRLFVEVGKWISE